MRNFFSWVPVLVLLLMLFGAAFNGSSDMSRQVMETIQSAINGEHDTAIFLSSRNDLILLKKAGDAFNAVVMCRGNCNSELVFLEFKKDLALTTNSWRSWASAGGWKLVAPSEIPVEFKSVMGYYGFSAMMKAAIQSNLKVAVRWSFSPIVILAIPAGVLDLVVPRSIEWQT